ncbi:plasma membrane-associated cation-binding protein 1-like [Tasmannia lanceolata]|uniref:plasma membrane-associated cation-binding protein 1-like n=1 Tax=Tasmannia lanceolata TaxID=3420 RepID=UPI004063C36B
MGYWKSKVLPRIKKVFERNATKKAAAAEACKSFDESKEGINNEFEEKKIELQPKVIEIYEASSTEVKTVVKERKDDGIKKNPAAVHKFLEELVKIDFPGSKQVCEASSNFGPSYVSGPVFFVFEKVSIFIITEEKEVETTAEETSKEKEVIIEERGKGKVEEKEELKEKEEVKEKEVEVAEKDEIIEKEVEVKGKEVEVTEKEERTEPTKVEEEEVSKA